MNVYTGQFVDDVDDDGVADIVNVHGGDPFAQPGQFSSSFTSNNAVFGHRRTPTTRHCPHSPAAARRCSSNRSISPTDVGGVA